MWLILYDFFPASKIVIYRIEKIRKFLQSRISFLRGFTMRFFSFFQPLFLIFIAFIEHSLSARIIEAKNMRELLSYLEPGTLIIFDIDNTLIEPTQELGNDQWFHYRLKSQTDNGMKPETALKHVVAEWHAIQAVTEVKFVEPETEVIIDDLQKKCWTIIGLTTRALGISDTTIEQLASLDINLSVTAPYKEDVFFYNGLPVLYRKGILFTGGSNKGKALEKFLHAIRYSPKNIVFINDKEAQLTEVDEIWKKKKGTFFTGLRYGYLDEKVKLFQPEVAEIQHQFFGRILTDSEAKALIENRRQNSNLSHQRL